MTGSVFLRGKVSGYVRFYTQGGGLRYKIAGLPEGSRVFIVNAEEKAVPASKAKADGIRGVIITDAAGNVIAEGRAARTAGTNAHAKLGLPRVAGAGIKKDVEPHSAALDEIIERMEYVFSPPEQTVAPKAAQKQQTGYNPFSGMYPDSVWRRVGSGRFYRLTGTARVAGHNLVITAIPAGAYSDAAFAREGFNKIARADDGTTYRMRVERR